MVRPNLRELRDSGICFGNLEFGQDFSRCIRCIELARARAAEAGVGHLCSWLRCDMLQLPEAKT